MKELIMKKWLLKKPERMVLSGSGGIKKASIMFPSVHLMKSLYLIITINKVQS